MIARRPVLAGIALAVLVAGCAAKQPEVTSKEGLAWIAQGSPEAIAAAVNALPRSNAARAERLHDALAHAMQSAPDRVLPLVGTADTLSARNVCVPMLAEGATPKEQKDDLARSRKAIESVTDPALAKAKEACLAELVQVETAVDRGEEE